ncbi:MAG: hypothetical protein ACRDK3_12970 [Actinomycetota bacterium]
MTGYQLFLLLVIIIWPLAIGGLLFAMSGVETWIERMDAATPEEAGLEPVAGGEREVKIVFGDRVVGEPGDTGKDAAEAPADPSAVPPSQPHG